MESGRLFAQCHRDHVSDGSVREMIMRKSRIVAVAVFFGVVAVMGAVHSKPVSYKLPEETTQFKPGPNLEAAQKNCTACHSADYILTQPRGPKFKKDFWTAEVNKMIKVYGAPIEEADIGKIVDYLSATY